MVEWKFWRRRRRTLPVFVPEIIAQAEAPAEPVVAFGESFNVVFGADATTSGRAGAARRSVVFVGHELAGLLCETLSAIGQASAHCTFSTLSLRETTLEDPRTRKIIGSSSIVFVQAIPGLDLKEVRTLSLGADNVVFPDLTMCGIWPFDAANGARDPMMERKPDCAFRHADAALVQLRQLEPDKKKRLQRYIDLDFPAASVVAPAIEAQDKMLAAVDADADIKVGRFISRSYRDTQLFYNSTSPTSVLMQQLAELAWIKLKISQTLPEIPGQAVQKQWSVPVHPAIARKQGLLWATGATKYQYGSLGEVTWREWVEAYIDQLG